MKSRSLGHRAPLLWLVLPFMGGLIFGKVADLRATAWTLALAAAAAAVSIVGARRNERVWAVATVLALFAAGTASYSLHRARIGAWDTLPAREAHLTVRIDRVFAETDAKRTRGLGTIIGTEPHLRELTGQRVYFSLTVDPLKFSPLRSSEVRAVGVISPVAANPPGQSFESYLANSGINFRFTRGRIVAVEQDAPAYHRFCAAMAVRFADMLSLGVDDKQPELTSVLRAMMLGQKHELSDEQDTLFMRSGTMHLFAISGLHIGMIAVAVHALLALLRLPASVRFVLGLVVVWLYVEITGATPSAVRAFIMVTLVEAALLLRTPRNPLAALATSAFIVLLLWPLQLFSASFQLSYGIVAALLLFGLPLADRWQERWPLFAQLPTAAWRRWQHFVAWLHRETLSAVAIGIASTLVSTVGGLMFFQLFTPGALLANLVLIPASLIVILAGVGSLLAGLIGLTPVCALFNHAAVLVLAAIDAGVRGTVAIPGSWMVAQLDRPWLGPAAFGLLLAALVAGYLWDWRSARGGWWPPLAIVALLLIGGTTFG